VELLVFGKTAERVGGLLIEDEIVEIDLKINHKDGALRISADDVRRVGEHTVAQHERIAITRAKYTPSQIKAVAQKKALISFANGTDPSAVSELSKVLRSLPPGDTQISVRILGSTIRTSFMIALDESTQEQLQSVPNVESIIIKNIE
jgi:hypothetical protein